MMEFVIAVEKKKFTCMQVEVHWQGQIAQVGSMNELIGLALR